MPYGDRFRKHRRLIAQVLNSQAVTAYRDYQMNNTSQLLKNLLRNPNSFELHVVRLDHPHFHFPRQGSDIMS